MTNVKVTKVKPTKEVEFISVPEPEPRSIVLGDGTAVIGGMCNEDRTKWALGLTQHDTGLKPGENLKNAGYKNEIPPPVFVVEFSNKDAINNLINALLNIRDEWECET